MDDHAIRIEGGDDVRAGRSAVRRPVLRWHGGKWRTAPWIVDQLPPHRSYVEPYGGAASVLMRKPRCHTEIYNDLDSDVVNLFRVLRSSQAPLLRQLLELTPFSRDEYDRSYEATDDPVERARRLVIRSFMGRGSDSPRRKTGFRAQSRQSSTGSSMDWRNYPDSLVEVVERLRGVTVECLPALDIIRKYDATDTLFYVDPPYLPEVRDTGRDYVHEMSMQDHMDLLEVLGRVRGMVVLSGYPSPLYDRILRGWRSAETSSAIDMGGERTEKVWLNQASVQATPSREQVDLFGSVPKR
jgi:DNA adenine methylase